MCLYFVYDFILNCGILALNLMEIVAWTGMNCHLIDTTGLSIAAESACDTSSIITTVVPWTQSLTSLPCLTCVLPWTRGVPAGTA